MRKTFSTRFPWYTIKTIILKAYTIASKINVTTKGVYLPISNPHSILAVANLLAHNNKSQICYCGQISLQGAAVNCRFSDTFGGNIYFAGDGTFNYFIHFLRDCLDTHVTIVIQLVVGEFEFVEGNELFHPVGPFGRGLGMDVNPGRGIGVGLPCHNPRRASLVGMLKKQLRKIHFFHL